jgi:hypothetical protein
MNVTQPNPAVRLRRLHLERGRLNHLIPLILAVILGGSSSIQAQETNLVAATNELMQADDATDAGQNGDAMQEDQGSEVTNVVSGSNQVITPGPDGRTRRQRRRPPTRPRDPLANRAGNPNSVSGTNGGPSSLDYAAFRIVAERNIFDPNRSPRNGPRPSGAPPKTNDSFTLVGTMSYEKGDFAFFDGTSTDYKKAVKTNDTIAGYKVAAIATDSVKLAQNTNVLELAVGAQLRRQDDGTWVRSTTSESYAAAPSGTTTSSSATSAADNDVLKKMMMRRDKE